MLSDIVNYKKMFCFQGGIVVYVMDRSAQIRDKLLHSAQINHVNAVRNWDAAASDSRWLGSTTYYSKLPHDRSRNTKCTSDEVTWNALETFRPLYTYNKRKPQNLLATSGVPDGSLLFHVLRYARNAFILFPPENQDILLLLLRVTEVYTRKASGGEVFHWKGQTSMHSTSQKCSKAGK